MIFIKMGENANALGMIAITEIEPKSRTTPEDVASSCFKESWETK